MISVLIVSIFIVTVSTQESVSPLEYTLTIIPDFTDLTFTSEVKILILVGESDTVENVTLNVENLEIEEVVIRDYSTNDESTVIFSLEQDLVLQFEEPLESGTLHEISINYSGKINENKEGFYLEKYTRANGTEGIIALTNFHYNKARQVLPCFDTPTLPATFIVNIVRPKSHIAVTNVPRNGQEEINENSIKDTFSKTKLIPTYMLSFAIIDFDKDEDKNIVVYSLNKEETKYLKQWSSEVAKKFQELEPITLPKLYQIVVPDSVLPKDVVVNFGLIFYRQSAVFYNTEQESVQDKQEVSKLIAGAIVKQWYYGQDSFKWWPNFWSIEGTNIWYQYNVLDELQPLWRLREQFLVEEIDDLLDYDIGGDEISLILTENDTPDSYSDYERTKAFAFVRMFSRWPNPPSFEDEDNVIITSWTEKRGYPILRVTRTIENNVVTFAQESSNVRQIPISISFEQQTETLDNEFDLILDSSTATTNFSSLGSWYLVNLDRLGYYRTNYGTRNWNSIAAFLENPQNNIEKISPANRAILISDASYLAELGLLSYPTYLELIRYLAKEEDYIPLYAFLKTTSRLKALLAKTDTQELFMTYARNFIQHLYNKVGTSISPEENHLDTIKRIHILTWLCSFGHQQCQTEMFAILSSLTSTHPDLQEAVYCGGMRLGGVEHFAFIHNEHVNHKKRRILKSMGCTSNSDLLEYYIKALINESTIVQLDPEHKVDAFLAIIEGSDIGVDVAVDFVKQHLEKILDSFTYEEISTMFIALSKKLVTDEHATRVDEIIACFDEVQNETYGDLLQKVKNNVDANRAWRSSQVNVIHSWLASNVEGTTSTVTTTSGRTTTDEETTTPSSVGNFQLSSVCVFVYLLVQSIFVD